MTWSDAKVKPITWHWKGANLQFLAQSAAPIQIGAQAGMSFDRTINTIKFTPAGNYLECLNSSSMEQIIIYDVSEGRAWLVPLICVLHHMLLAYSQTIPAGFGRQDIPRATPSSDGASSSWTALRDNGGYVISGWEKIN